MTAIPTGMPGIQAKREAIPRKILATGEGALYMPGGKIIDGAESRDVNNTGDQDTLRAGLVMGKITSSGKYAPSIIGLTGVLYDTSVVTTTMTLPAAVVTELQRRVGLGDFTIIGPPTAAGTVASETLTIAAYASATTITLDSAGAADFAAGSIIAAADGSEAPLCLIGDGFGVKVTDQDANDIDVPFVHTNGGKAMLIGGVVDSSQIIDWSSDASVKAWLVSQLSAVGPFVFDHQF